MQGQSLSLKSPRYKKALYARFFEKKGILPGLLSVALLSAAAGLFLIFEKNRLGFIALIPAVPCMILRWWYAGDLAEIGQKVDERSVDGLLDPRILANLKSENPSAYVIWEASRNMPESFFLQNRFMLPYDVFGKFLSKEPGSGALVWQQAEILRGHYGTTGYTPSVIMIALLRTIPNIENMLRNVKLELNDLYLSIPWVENINRNHQLAKQRKSFGGLARDWAYGYTPTLKNFGRDITEEIQYGGFYLDTSIHDRTVDQMVSSMGSGTSTMTLVGDVGVGKTTTIYAFAKRLIEDGTLPENIRYNQVFTLDAPTLVAHASGPGQLERLMIQVLNEANRAKNIILFFDDAQVFFGQGSTSVDLSNILLQVLEAGTVRMIFAVTPRDWQNISANNAALAGKLQPLQIRQADEEETLKVLRDEVLFVEYQHKTLFTYQALREAVRLGNRYEDNQSMPGAAISVLKTAASTSQAEYITPEAVQKSIEATVGVKLQHAEGQESNVLLHMEDELHKYVINQKQAVSVIANALRRSRSGVGNPERPVGTFLFLGPTGVGKTELSKALARVYFGDEKSMIRVDMNQFVNPEDVRRLITPMLGEQLGFLGQVRRSPFSVILLDEIEKAHPNVTNLLLQMLDEGVMRDTDNKPVSFKDAIIIATSNAGADEIRRLISEGQDVSKLQEQLVNLVIDRGIFAPEFVNRFDEVVVFRPLNPDELVQVIDLIINDMNRTLDSQKVQVELTNEAKKWLVAKGYDAKLGARPMRRVVQRYVENILAKRLLEKSVSSGSKIVLDVKDFEEIGEG